MQKVYLLTRGQYSDFRVEGAFSCKEKGEAWLKKLEGTPRQRDYHDLEEYVLDSMDPDQVPQDAYAAMDYKTGDLLEYRFDSLEGWERMRLGRVILEGAEFYDSSSVDTISMYFDHRDKERAIKVLAEKRAQMRAQYSDQPADGYYNRDTLARDL